ncbi:MAG: MIP/aquaporin family protein [Micromonosporaceae bacterium]
MRAVAEGRTPLAVPRLGSPLFGALLAEVIGTYILTFFGAGTVTAVVLFAPESSANVISISVAFGLAVLVAVYAFGHVSGAHINPTVTIALAAVRRFPWRAVPAYLLAQFVGAILAALTIWALFGEQGRDAPVLLGATSPGLRGAGPAFLAEVVLGFLLVVVVLATATDRRANPAVAGLAIGFVIGAGIFVTLTVSGGSFNAARSLGPMIVAWQFPSWWVYLIAPAAGGVLGALCYDLAVRPGAPPETEEAAEEAARPEEEAAADRPRHRR